MESINTRRKELHTLVDRMTFNSILDIQRTQSRVFSKLADLREY